MVYIPDCVTIQPRAPSLCYNTTTRTFSVLQYNHAHLLCVTIQPRAPSLCYNTTTCTFSVLQYNHVHLLCVTEVLEFPVLVQRHYPSHLLLRYQLKQHTSNKTLSVNVDNILLKHSENIQFSNKRAQRALGRSPEEKVKGHSVANNREPQGHNLNNFGRGPFNDVIY